MLPLYCCRHSGLSLLTQSRLRAGPELRARVRAGTSSRCSRSNRNCRKLRFVSAKYALTTKYFTIRFRYFEVVHHLMPERKKNMGMFQAFMLMMNQSPPRCQ